jgi:hypothetical protein
MIKSWMLAVLAIAVFVLSVMLFQQVKVTDRVEQELYNALVEE